MKESTEILCWAQMIVRDGHEEYAPCRYTSWEDMRHETTIPQVSMYDADFCHEHGVRYPEGVSHGEDWVFWMRMLKAGAHVEVTEQAISAYRIWGSSASTRVDPLATAQARNIVLRENTELYSVEELAEELVGARILAAKYRKLMQPLWRLRERIGH